MKHLFYAFSILLFAGCGAGPDAVSRLLRPEALPSRIFTVNTARDTMLVLSGGTQIVIPADAIKAAASSVRLEAREALTMEQIVRGGLFTKSERGALSSGGMLYVGLAEGEEATIQKPLRARVPTRSAVPGMELYRGRIEDDGSMVWTDPQLLSTTLSPPLEKGKALFRDNCASCHNPAKDATGPSLYHALDHWESKEEMYAFTRNPAGMIASGHLYANCIYEAWSRTQMTAFPMLSDNELDLIHAWADVEGARRLGADTSLRLAFSRDSCRARKAALDAISTEMAKAQSSRRPTVQVDIIPSQTASSLSRDTTGIPGKVAPEYDVAEYYNIDITAFGWYNIDVLLAEVRGVEESRLVVRLQGAYTTQLRLMLVIPSHKVFAEGGKLNNGDGYGFYSTDGRMPLPQGVPAYILALGEQKDKAGLLLGQTNFTTTRDQTVVVQAAPTDSLRLMAAIRAVSGETVSARVTRDTAAEKVRVLTANFDRLIAAYNRICACYEIKADSASNVRELSGDGTQ